MQLQVVMLKQDDPKKCSAAKLVKFGLATSVKKTSQTSLILNPFAKQTLMPNDEGNINSITAIDCSWDLADQAFTKKLPGIHRKLPPLFAGNPVNYSKLNKLTTVEAIAGAVFIIGKKELGFRGLNRGERGYRIYCREL